MFNNRVAPYWWPILGLAFPIIFPFLIKKNKQYKLNKEKATNINKNRISKVNELKLPEVDFLKLTTLVESKTKNGFNSDAAVSYIFETNKGTSLFDVGHGEENNAFKSNSEKLDINLKNINSIAISHLHKDHMGGFKASRENTVKVPLKSKFSKNINCYLPNKSKADGFNSVIINKPTYLKSGITSTGPLARSLFLLGYTEEQALIINIKDKGLAVFTGCGHPTIKVIIDMVKKISNIPIYAIGGGLHFPLHKGRGAKYGIDFQRIFGTGKRPWDKITNNNIKSTINIINKVNPKKVFLSGHDSSDYALELLKDNLTAETKILKAGKEYVL